MFACLSMGTPRRRSRKFRNQKSEVRNPKLTSASLPPREKVLTVGLIGGGRIGRLHAEHLSCRIPQARLLKITDVNEEAARDCAQRFGIPEWGTDSQELISRPEIQ